MSEEAKKALTDLIKEKNEHKKKAPPEETTNTDLIKKEAHKEELAKQEEKLKLEEEEAERKKQEEEERANAVIQVKNVVANTGQAAQKAVEPVHQLIINAPTPGGIASILLVIGFFLLAVVPVNPQGDTRLKLIWLTLTGKTHLKYSETKSTGIVGAEKPTKTGVAGGGASGNFPASGGGDHLPQYNVPSGLSLFGED
jgi:hypothetical protein